jgi:hypothetical protein
VFFLSCYKFDENILLFKDVHNFLKYTTWELVSYTKNGQKVFTFEKYLGPKIAHNNRNFLKGSTKEPRIMMCEYDSSIKGKCYYNEWRIIKLNS